MIKKRPFFSSLLLIFSLLGSLNLFAQNTATLKGRIIDSDNHPIPQAYILTNDLKYTSLSDEEGYYSLVIPSDTSLKINFSHIAFNKKSIVVTLSPGEIRVFDINLLYLEMQAVDIVADESRSENLQRINVKSVGIQPSVTGGIEGMIKSTGIGVTARDELSASYSVRGGSFDENLVYVNGLEIYRPQLIRAGQEEGLSFINANLVESVNFSAGGYAVNYGDKMASVLDVKYRRPVRLGASMTLSLLGADFTVEGISKDEKLAAIIGFRYKTTQYVLSTFDTQGEYAPNFLDLQTYISYRPNQKSEVTYLGYLANNKYVLYPESRSTELGNLSEALRLDVVLDGKEESTYKSFFNALAYNYYLNKDLKINFQGSVSVNEEIQSFDVSGFYILGEIDREFGSETYGDVIANRGVGAFIEHSRDRLNSQLYAIQHNGNYDYDNKQLTWGLEYKHEQIQDHLDEWIYQDSAGYSVPRDPSNQILLNNVVKGDNNIISNRYIGYVKNSWKIVNRRDELIDFNIGVRAQYWDFNDQLMISPRGSISYKPNLTRIKNDSTVIHDNITVRFATGVYYQPPFYHAMVDMSGKVPENRGKVNPDIKAQQSLHFILGLDYVFFMFKRPFKWTTEIFYKPMTKLIPFQVNNIRLEYYATNNSNGYAYGMDMKLNGEFIKGIESFVGLGILSNKENLTDDYYYNYYNDEGQQLYPPNNNIVDSTRVEPGFIPRPFDSRFSFSLMFQDEMPRWPSFKVHLNLTIITGFPYGPPNGDRYTQTARSSPYRRVDIGFSKTFVDPKTGKTKGMFKPFKDAWISLEIFNLIDISNTISYNWVEDVTGRMYAVPNYLTGRRVNIKLHLAF